MLLAMAERRDCREIGALLSRCSRSTLADMIPARVFAISRGYEDADPARRRVASKCALICVGCAAYSGALVKDTHYLSGRWPLRPTGGNGMVRGNRRRLHLRTARLESSPTPRAPNAPYPASRCCVAIARRATWNPRTASAAPPLASRRRRSVSI
jgi:hypothetical protein